MAELRRPAIWSSVARSDLSEIWNYYVRIAGPHTADGIVREIVEACRVLEDISLQGVLATRFVKVYAPSQQIPTSYSIAS